MPVVGNVKYCNKRNMHAIPVYTNESFDKWKKKKTAKNFET